MLPSYRLKGLELVTGWKGQGQGQEFKRKPDLKLDLQDGMPTDAHLVRPLTDIDPRSPAHANEQVRVAPCLALEYPFCAVIKITAAGPKEKSVAPPPPPCEDHAGYAPKCPAYKAKYTCKHPQIANICKKTCGCGKGLLGASDIKSGQLRLEWRLR